MACADPSRGTKRDTQFRRWLPLTFYRGVGSLIENTPVALRGSMAVGYSRALFVSGAYSHPGGEVLLGRKSRCPGTHFGYDLLL